MTADNSAAALDPLHARQGRNYVWLLNLLAGAQIAFYLTTAIWVGPFEFPQVPLLSLFRDLPQGVEFAAFIGSLAGTFFAKSSVEKRSRQIRHIICAASFVVLFGFNQHRLQPWAYQLFLLHAWLAWANPRWRLTGWRWLTISIYLYSALSKLDYSFCTQHGPFLWDGFLHACGFADGTAHWPVKVRFLAAALMPVAEFTTALCLGFQRTQRFGLFLSMLMHLFLIVALGPWGHNHSAGVLLWNGFFIMQNWLLFSGPISPGDSPGAKTVTLRDDRGIIAWTVLAIALLAPLGEPFGLWDHWPSWAVYAARPEKTTVFIHEDDLELIPVELRRYLQSPAPLEPWHAVRIDRWSLDAAKVPIYPQDRFQVGVALALAERCQLTTIRLTIDGPPNRWTGRRVHQEYVSLDAVRQHAATYLLNALPR